MIFSASSPVRFQSHVGLVRIHKNSLSNNFATYDPQSQGRGEQRLVFQLFCLSDTDVYGFHVNGIPYQFSEGTQVSTPHGVVSVESLKEGDMVHYLLGYGQYGELDGVEHEAAMAGSSYSGTPGDDPEWLYEKGIGAKIIFLLNADIPNIRYTPFLSSIAAAYGVRLVDLEGKAYLAGPKEPYDLLRTQGELPAPRLVSLPVTKITKDLRDGIFFQNSSVEDEFLLAEGLLVR